MLDMIHYKKFPFTKHYRNYHFQRSLPGIPVMNQTHPIPTSHLSLLILTFVLHSSQLGAAWSVQLGYMLEVLGSNLGWSKKTIFSPNHLGQGRQSDHSHPYRARFKNQWSYTSTQPVCLPGTYWDNFTVPRRPTYVPKTELSSSVISHVLISGI
jgi:hypothetical protein